MRVTVVSLLALLLLVAVPSPTRAESPSQVAEVRVPLASADSGAFVSELGVNDAAQSAGSWLLLNPPAARSQHSAVWDPTNGQMLVFGGQAGARLNDLWSYRPTVNTWALLTPSGEPPPPVTGHSAVWDPVRNQMLIYGGHGGGATDLWSYDPAAGVWTPLNPSGRHPETRGYHSAVWDTANDQMLVFGGLGNSFSVFDDVWGYRPASDTWAQFAPRGARPLARFYQGAVWDPVRSQMLVFGGTEPFSGRRLDDLWAYKPSPGTWTQLTPGERPPERLSHSTIWDPVADQMIIFGGGCGAGCYRDDMWGYRPTTNTWSKLPMVGASVGSIPAARGGHSGIWDTSAGRLLIFAGSQPKGTLNDFWSYQPSSAVWTHLDLDPPVLPLTTSHRAVWDTQRDQMLVVDASLQLIWSYRADQNSWSERAPIGPTPPAREGASAIWDPERAQLIVFGGLGGTGYQNELWSYRPTVNSWTKLAPNGPLPPARWHHSATWDPERARMLVFGGHDGNLLDDLWSYDPAGNAWEQLASSGPAPSSRQEHSAVWGGGQLIVFGGEAAGPLDDLWSYQPATSAWKQLTPAGERPAARFGHAAAWDPTRLQMLVLGGLATDDALWTYHLAEDRWTRRAADSASPRSADSPAALWDPIDDQLLSVNGPRNGRGGDLWAYQPTAQLWERPAPTRAAPPARQSHAAVWDPEDASILLFGGLIGGADFLADLWTYRAASRSWHELTPDGPTPPEVSNHTAVWDPSTSQMHIYGGFGPTGYLRDVWTYRLATNDWNLSESVAASDDASPPDREDHSAVWDSQDARMLIFGGGREGRPFDDLWSWDPVRNAWTELTPEGPRPAARFRHSAIWDADGARMLVFGGYGGDFPGGYLNDLWSYDPAANTWTELALDGDAPPPRATQGAAWNADSGRLLIVGGFSGGIDYLGDLWSYDAATDMWSNVTPDGLGPTPRASTSAVWDGARLLVYGGSGGSILGELWSFRPPEDTAH